jgi:hypothetical protein
VQACSSVDFQKKLLKDTCQDLHESTPPRVGFRGRPCVRIHLTGCGLAGCSCGRLPGHGRPIGHAIHPTNRGMLGGVSGKTLPIGSQASLPSLQFYCRYHARMQVRKRFQRTVQLDIDAYASWMCQKVMLYDMFQEEQPSSHCTPEANFYVPVFPLSIEIASSRVSISQWWACRRVA